MNDMGDNAEQSNGMEMTMDAFVTRFDVITKVIDEMWTASFTQVTELNMSIVKDTTEDAIQVEYSSTKE